MLGIVHFVTPTFPYLGSRNGRFRSRSMLAPGSGWKTNG